MFFRVPRTWRQGISLSECSQRIIRGSGPERKNIYENRVRMEMNSATIMIIDDKDSNIRTLESLLEQEGRTFMHATSGADGLKLALTHSIDLIFLDVQMPQMDGFEVAQILKSNKKTKQIPIIFASAEAKG